MEKLIVFLSICFFIFSGSAWAQSNYLIRVDQISQLTIDQIRKTEIEVYAKTTDFWVAGASKKDLEFLTEERIAFQILDQEATIGEHYLVWSRPTQEIHSQLQKLKPKPRVLFADQNVAVLKGNPKKIEELASLGFSLKKIHKKPLPLEPKAFVPSYLEFLSPEYDPLIDSMVNKVDQAQLLSWIDDLTGEDTVLIGGMEDSIKTRYSYSDGILKAADYLKERFEEMGLSVELDPFQLHNPRGFFWDVACSPDGQKAWSVGSFTGIIKTTDGGNSWIVTEGSDSLALYDICRVQDDTLWSVGDNGAITRSTDGGDTWESKTKPEFAGLEFRGCYFEDAHSGWVVGWQKILFTTDGGATWIEQAQVPGVRLQSVDFVDPYKGWVVGSKETILHTTDRGASWSYQYSSGTLVELTCVDFVDSANGWAVGTSRRALCTTDGGTNWIPRDFPTTSFLSAIEFVDSLHGWIVGTEGTILYTSDCGVNWISQGSFTDHLYGLDFADTSIGWVSGNCVIIKTTNGGQSWSVSYRVDTWNIFNVVATIDGMINPGRQVLLTAHYDAMSEDPYNLAPGADDNASGTVSLLAAASILKDYHFVNTIKFVSFAAEEVGIVGSATYAEEAYNRGDTILGVLNFDMIAYDGNDDDIMHMYCDTVQENQALADILIEAISDYGLYLSPVKLTDRVEGDHASFWDYEFPAIMVIEDDTYDFNPFYHTTGDRVSAFDTAYYVDFTKAAVAGISILGNPFIIGDANGDGMIDAADIVYLINYLFVAGSPAPDPLWVGDCNCDEVIDAADVVYLINCLFAGGPPPDC